MPHDVTMPQLGMAQDTGVIVSWQKKPGDPVKVGDILMEVETDKATMEVEAVNEGFLAEIRAEPGAEVPVGDVIGVISESAEDVKASSAGGAPETRDGADAEAAAPPAKPEKGGAAGAPEKPATQSPPPKTRPASPISAPAPRAGDRILASPKARWEAHRRGVDLGRLVRHGVPQPFHVADLDAFRPEAASAHGAGLSILNAQFDATGFDEFVLWADGAADGAAGRCEILAAFAAGAYRAARRDAGAESGIAVRITSPCTGDEDLLLENPDLHGLSSQISSPANGKYADIAIVDLFDSDITGYKAGEVSSQAVLVITGEAGAGQIAFSFSEDVLPLDAAVHLLNDLTDRIREPLRHLL